MTIASTTTRDSSTPSHQPTPSTTPGTGPTPDTPNLQGSALQAKSRIHNRAGITMLVAAARGSQPTAEPLIRVRVLAAAEVSCGA